MPSMPAYFFLSSAAVVWSTVSTWKPQAAEYYHWHLELMPKLNLHETPVCIAKTQYSFSDDPTKLGAPSGFTLHVRDILPSAGAGFIVALAGDIMTMPGLGKSPAAERIRLHPDGTIEGLF